MNSFTVTAINKSNDILLLFDTTLLKDGDTVQTLTNLVCRENVQFGTDLLVYYMCPYPKLVSQNIKLVNNGIYKFAFNTKSRSFNLCDMKEISEYVKYPDPYAHEIELLMGDSNYFGQVSTITREDQKDVVPHGYGRIITTEYTYSGLWFYGNIEGEGETCFNDGRIYTGLHTLEGIIEGVETCVRDTYVYRGSFFNWAKHGKGKEYFPDGSTAEGDYEDDDFVKGTLVWANGTIEIGEFYTDDGDYYLKNGTSTKPDCVTCTISKS